MTQVQPTGTKPELTALDVQRRLELKEFFLSKNDNLSAALVDNMFDLAGFEGVKGQVLSMYNELPCNWCTKDRYAKYKKLLKHGVTPTMVRKEMALDGIDPEELAWDDEANREAKLRLTQNTGRRGTLQGMQKKSSNYGNTLFRKKKKTPRKASLVDLGMDEYEIQADLERLRCQSMTGTGVEEDSQKKKRGQFKVFRKQMTKKKRPMSSRRKERTRRETESDHTDTSSLDSLELEMVELTEEDYKNRFHFRKSEVEEEAPRGNRRSSVLSTLTKKNKVGHLHDYVPFFKQKPDEMLRKTSVGNIKRRMTDRSRSSRGRTRSRHGSVFYEDDGKDLIVDSVKVAKTPPVAPPRTRRTDRIRTESESRPEKEV